MEIFVLTFSLKSFKSSGVGNGNLLQYSCLENSMEHGGLYNPWGHKESDVTKHSLTLKSFIPVVHQKGVLKEVTFGLVSGLEVDKYILFSFEEFMSVGLTTLEYVVKLSPLDLIQSPLA